MSETPMTVRELRARMDAGLARFEAALDRLSEEQLTGPKDAAGWSVRDHLTHLAVWADGITALLRGEDRWKAMGISPDLTTSTAGGELDYDAINEQIAERHRQLSAAEARALLAAAHQRLAAEVDKLTDEQLAWRDYLRGRGVACTDVFDRGAFRSIYVRDPDGHIIEIATRGPGFARDGS